MVILRQRFRTIALHLASMIHCLPPILIHSHWGLMTESAKSFNLETKGFLPYRLDHSDFSPQPIEAMEAGDCRHVFPFRDLRSFHISGASSSRPE